jgi:diguanylate cyclase (GGDEF)-like protein
VVDAIIAAASELATSPGESPRRAVLLMIDGLTMTMTGQRDPASASPASQQAIPVAQSPYVRRVIATGLPVVASFHHDEFGPVVQEILREAGITNGALVPMLSEGRVFAIIAVMGTAHLHVSQLQVEHLQTLATIGALAFANASAHSRAEALARTDPLTGIGNRRALADRLAQLGRRRFAIIAIDVDGLKVVNDTYGHDAGDALLSGLATAMTRELRPSDVLVRTGGDEFVALRIDCDAEGAAQFCVRLQRAVGQLVFSWGAPSVSMGSASGAPGDSPTDVATRADQALYAARQAVRTERAAAAAALEV